MGVLLGNEPALDPAALYRQCVEADPPLPTDIWFGKCNRFTQPIGEQPGTGGLLLSGATLDKLDLNTSYDLTFDDLTNPPVVFHQITVTSARCVTPGLRGDPAAAYFAEVADRRKLMAAVPIDRAYNRLSCDGTGYFDATLNGGSPWTWQQVVQDLATALGLGTVTLPFTPDGTPENLLFFGDYAWHALNVVARLIGCAVLYDPTDDEDGVSGVSVVQVGVADADADSVLDGLDALRVWDYEPRVLTLGNGVPAKVRVRFRRYPPPADGTTPYYYVEKDPPGTLTTATAPDSAVWLDDDLAARCDGSNAVTNGTALGTRATERAAEYYRALTGAGADPLLRVYAGVQLDAGPGAKVKAVVVQDTGGGYKTEVYRGRAVEPPGQEVPDAGCGCACEDPGAGFVEQTDHCNLLFSQEACSGGTRTVTETAVCLGVPARSIKVKVTSAALEAEPTWVSYVGLTPPAGISVTPPAITDAGTFVETWDDQPAHYAFIGPASGADAPPTWRLFVTADIPDGIITLAKWASGILDTDGTLAANSDAKVASQKATKTYVDNAVTGLLDLKGGTDCSANPNYPAALKGDAYVVTVAGRVGGASGKVVDAGDVYFATADNAGGTEASVGASWTVVEHNVIGPVSGPASATDLDFVLFDGTSGKLIKDGFTTVPLNRGGTNATTALAARASLGVAIGTDVQAWDADLDALAALAATAGMVSRTGAGAFAVRTITGTSARISVTNGTGASGNPAIDIDSGYVGQASITTLGTITTGVWTGTTIAVANGGTGATTAAAAFNALSPLTTLGDLLYGGASGAGTRLAGNTSASMKLLTQTGAAGVSAAPTWELISAVLDVLFGSTQGLVAIRGASAWTATGPGTAGQALVSNGAGANPSFKTPSIGGTGIVTLTYDCDGNATGTLDPSGLTIVWT